MKKVIIDTSCLISYVSDRNPIQQGKVAELFEKNRQLKTRIVCHHHVISEFVYVMTSVYALKPVRVQQILSDLIALPGINYTSDVDMQIFLSLWPEKIPDYGDAVLASFCKQTKGTQLATFDKKFIRALTKIKLSVWQF